MPNVNPGAVSGLDHGLTGERTVPDVPSENYWFRRHEIAYAALASRVRGRSVVDVGCGVGYGTALLAAVATDVIGLDYDHGALAYARSAYPSTRFVAGNLAALPMATSAADTITALQLIEHVWDHGEFLRECRRVLLPGGELIVTTPNRLTFSPGADPPRNTFHTVEFTAAELTALLAANGFGEVEVRGVYAGRRLREFDVRDGGSFVEAQLAVPPAQWSAQLVADVGRIGISDFTLRSPVGADVDESLDLFVVARR